MATTHIFIVDTTTFKYHLEYLFVGTGAKDAVIDFNANSASRLPAQTENNLVSMIADSQRVREGDFVIFYLQQNISQGVYDGKFYGIFKVGDDLSFLDNNTRDQFLRDKLNKSLTFRAIVEPYKVYAQGVTEWEALDEIRYIKSPNQMLWSLIYRKLKGNRGNTMITIYESERLVRLLSNKNQRGTLGGQKFTYDAGVQEIKKDTASHSYTGHKTDIDVLPRLISKYDRGLAFESHLQAYIVQNVGRGTNKSLDDSLINNGFNIEWIGNEVSCGVGMQRIDVALSLVQDDQRVIVPLELKAVTADSKNIVQIQRYIDWLEQYYIPNRDSDIQPVLVAKKNVKKTSASYKGLVRAIKDFNRVNGNWFPLKYVEYELKNNTLKFEIINY
ncbi:DUF91 domain-containing protein [bacterium]|nr:DUF91 domain-containing protein [bacterium]